MKQVARLLFYQSLMELRRRHLGTLFGGVWSLVSPLVTMGIIYFVLTHGLKAGMIGNISFFNWLAPGMLAWIFISESISFSCTAILENSYLVTKVVFPVHILPVSKVFSCIPVHVCLMLILMLFLLFDGTGTIHTWWQTIYYFFCGVILCTAIGFISSACTVFVRDTVNVIGILIQIFFWVTPILWDSSIITNSRFRVLLLNPFNYVVQGYRDSMFNGIYFWERPVESIVFLIFILFTVAIGWLIFSRTRPHFADTL